MKALSVDLREKVLQAYATGQGSIRKIATLFRVSTSSITRWRVLERTVGSLEPQPHGGGQSRKINAKGEAAIQGWLERNNDLTIQELRDKYSKRFRQRVGTGTMFRALQRIGWTRKKKAFHAPEQDTERVQKLRQTYGDLVKAILAKKLVFVDEAGAHLGMCRDYGRSPQGTRAIGRRSVRPQRLNMVGAIGLDGFRALLTIDGTVDGEVFRTFVTTSLVPHLRRGDVVVLDNLSVHKVSGVAEAIESVGARVLFLPPYSPDLNPIEECWSKIKSILRKCGAQTERTFNRSLKTAMNAVTQQDILGWFTHCGYA